MDLMTEFWNMTPWQPRHCTLGAMSHEPAHADAAKHSRVSVFLAGGARGYGIASASSGLMRHLHPEEASLLCTVPLDFTFDMEPRAALCLLGQLATPTQVLWFQAQLLRHLQLSFWGSSAVDPLRHVMDLQNSLVNQHRQRWITASMYLPRELHLEDVNAAYSVEVGAPCRAIELLRAEQQLRGSSTLLQLRRGGKPLDDMHLLHEDELYPIAESQLADDTQSEDSWTLQTILGHGPTAETLPPLGLGDKILWHSIQCFLDNFDERQALCNKPFTIYPFRVGQFLTQHIHEAVQHNWRMACRQAEGTMMLIVEHNQHWVVLHSRAPGLMAHGAFWTCYDGLRSQLPSDEAQPSLETMLRIMAGIIDMPFHSLDFALSAACFFEQSLPFTRGTIALAHVALLCGAGYFIVNSELDTHMSLLELHRHPAVITAFGPAMPVELATLLTEKGVPQGAASGRAQQVITKLGYSQVQQILQSKNPWAGLKSAASKPGIMFRLVTEGELKQHIADRAQSKHGAVVRDHKNKKKVNRNPSEIQVDPSKLQLNANHFQDKNGQPVAQIAFTEVGADKRGVALCSAQQAAAFVGTKSISAEPLALLLVDAPQELIDSAPLTKMVVPAFCPGTEEHTLLFCWALQLGDHAVSRTRKTTGQINAPEMMSTQVVKIQIFRDQLEMPWQTFSKFPVKALVGITDALQLCPGGGCGADCPKLHAGIDETLDAVICEVWSRSFFDSKGQKAAAADSVCFTAFLRIPTSALKAALLSAAPKQHDAKFSVIWIPGASFEEAQHKRRTYPKSLGLVRLKDKYGIRVAKEDAAHAWSALRPGVDFVGLEIAKSFELSPIPHGTQRAQLVSLLNAWEWNARPLQPGRGTYSHMTGKLARRKTLLNQWCLASTWKLSFQVSRTWRSLNRSHGSLHHPRRNVTWPLGKRPHLQQALTRILGLISQTHGAPGRNLGQRAL